MNALAQQDLYLNSSQYTDLRKDVRANNEGANKKALQQFESLFISQMLKEMRSAAVIDEDQHSSYMDFYTDMYDKQLATIMAKQGGIGIANQLQQQLDLDANVTYEKDYSGGKFFPLNPELAADNGLPLKASNQGMPFRFENNDQDHEFILPINLNQQKHHDQVVEMAEEHDALAYAFGENSITDNVTTMKVALTEEFHQIQTNVDNSVVALKAIDDHSSMNHALVDEKIHAHKGWSQATDFIKELMPHAQMVAKQLGIKPEVIVAQSALETGWGKHTMRHGDGSVSFSLFGIKADNRWTGDTVQVSTLEYKGGQLQKEMAQFRAYDSVGEAIQDYVSFIKGNTRYQQALKNEGDDAHYVEGLQKAGYATDPNYANKILNILHGDTLKQGLASLDSMGEVA